MGRQGTKVPALCSRKCGHRPVTVHQHSTSCSQQGAPGDSARNCSLHPPCLGHGSKHVFPPEQKTTPRSDVSAGTFPGKKVLGQADPRRAPHLGSPLGQLSSRSFFWAWGAEHALVSHSRPDEPLTPAGALGAPRGGRSVRQLRAAPGHRARARVLDLPSLWHCHCRSCHPPSRPRPRP